MTTIDPLRIAQIFRSLASESGTQVQRNPNDSPHKHMVSGAQKEKGPKGHDKEMLRQRLRQRLLRLKQENIDFFAVAPEVTVKEVLIWEFGEQVMNHPEFNILTNKIIRTMQANTKAATQLQKLIREMTNQ